MRKITTAEWMGGAFSVALVVSITAYAIAIPSQRLGAALRDTARWSFLWFCLATYGGALTTLFGSSFHPLARRARNFGLGFAAAQLVHVALAMWFLYSSPEPFPRLPLIVFSVGVFWTYALAVFSFNTKLSAWLGPRRSRDVRTIGIEYIAFAYAFEFGSRILTGNRANALHYSPLFAAAVAGPLLRIGATIKRRSNTGNAAEILPG
jgi:hypothetical protein